MSILSALYYYNEQKQLHREDGPAVEYPNGTKYWFFNGMRHRIDGSAIETYSRGKFYYIMGKRYSYEKWLTIKDFPLLW